MGSEYKRTWELETIISKNAVKECKEMGAYLEGSVKSGNCF